MGDIVRAEGGFYIVVEVRRGRRWFTYTATTQVDLTQLTGSMTDRFMHIDKFAMDEVSGDWTVSLTYGSGDVTGKQYAHVWTMEAAEPERSPAQLDLISFTANDLLRIVVTQVLAGSVRVWFSYEEYIVQTIKAGRVPDKYKIATRWGWSRLITRAEDVQLGISDALRA